MNFLFRSSLAVACLSMLALLPGGVWSADFVWAEAPSGVAISLGATPIKALLGPWVLVRKAQNGGPEQPVPPAASTLMEFAQDGVVTVTKTHKDNPSRPDTRPGKYSVEGSTMLITDDQGNTARCEYRIHGDTLELAIPDIHREFYWRRVK